MIKVTKKSLGKKFADKTKSFFCWKYFEKQALENIFCRYDLEEMNILNVGCGTAKEFELLESLGARQGQLYGVDFDEQMIKRAKKQYSQATFKQGDIRDGIDFDVKFDLILGVHVLHYFNRKELVKIFQHFKRSLSTNGKVVFLVTHPLRWIANDLSDYPKAKTKKIETHWGTDMELVCNTFADYINSLTQAGFLVSRVEEPYPDPSVKKHDEKSYEKYTRAPSRLIVEAVKAS